MNRVSPPLPLNAPAYLRARQVIVDDIVDNRWAPGQRLRLSELSTRYRTTPMPMRDALLVLAGDGLVDLEGHQGATVVVSDARCVSNLCSIRLALQQMLAGAACRERSEAELAHSRELAVKLEMALMGRDVQTLFTAEFNFFDHLSRMGGNRHASELLYPRNCQLEAFRRSRPPRLPRHLPDWRERLRRLMRALHERDGLSARLAVMAHVEAMRSHLLSLVP